MTTTPSPAPIPLVVGDSLELDLGTAVISSIVYKPVDNKTFATIECTMALPIATLIDENA